MSRIVLFTMLVVLSSSCWSQNMMLNIDKIIEDSKTVEDLLNRRDSVGLSELIKEPDILNLRRSNYVEELIDDYHIMKSEGHHLDYDRNSLKRFSTDGQNQFYMFKVWVNDKENGSLLILTYREVDDTSLEIWDIVFSYEKDGEEKKVPKFPVFD